MRAVLCKEHGPPESLVVEQVPELRANPGTVLVGVKAAGVNFPDTLVIQGKYQFQPPLPFSPGGEVAGVVKEVGDGVEGFKPGDRVIALTSVGGFAEEVVCRPLQMVAMPDEMSFIDGSAFLFTYGTSHYALRDRANLRSGENLLVLGAAGGVGISAVEVGKAMGARVIAAASTKEKLDFCMQYGADEVINYSTEDLKSRIRELTGNNGADVVYDPVGGDYSEAALRSTNWDGRFLVIGFAAGDIPRIPLNLPLLKSASIVGVFWGMFTARDPKRNSELIAELVEWYREGKIKPRISKIYSLDEVPAALNDMMNRRVMGKAVIEI